MTDRIIKCTIGYDWNAKDGSSWHFGSYEGALKYCKQETAKGHVAWYSVEELFPVPCDSNDPDGKLCLNMGRHAFEEVQNENNTGL